MKDFKGIWFTPGVYLLDEEPDWRTPFEEGLKELINLIQIMIEDKKLSTNYENEQTFEFISAESIQTPVSKTLKEIRILIASPSDVLRERELILEKIETKFRREHYEERCNARIIVEGWEYIPSQTGYTQDIINSDLVKKANIILAVFRHRLGSPTIDIKTGKDRSPSGTAEELLYAIRNKEIKNPPIGMAYFYANAPVISLDSIDFDKTNTEWTRLKEFKKAIEKEILYKTYKLEEEILEIICKDLCENIIKYFK